MKKFLENFWYYHKFKLLVALMVVMVVVNTISELSAAETFDHHVGIVTMDAVSEDASIALSIFFSQILPDTDNDGKVTTEINVYHYGIGQDITPTSLTEDDAVHLAADIRVGMSSIFLTDQPAVLEEAGLVSLGSCADYPVFDPIPGMFSDFLIYAPDPAASFVMEALG